MLGIIDAVTAPSSGRPDERMAAPTCAQAVPIPPPIRISDAAIAPIGPELIVRTRPTNPTAVRSGPRTTAQRTRAGGTNALSSVPVVHASDWSA